MTTHDSRFHERGRFYQSRTGTFPPSHGRPAGADGSLPAIPLKA